MGRINGPLWIPAWQLHDRDPTLIMWKVSFRIVLIEMVLDTESFSVSDPGSLSRIRLFSIPDPNCFHPGAASKNLSLLTPKNGFLSSRKYDPGCSSRIPDPDPDFLPIPDPGSRGQKDTGSRIRIRNTGIFLPRMRILSSSSELSFSKTDPLKENCLQNVKMLHVPKFFWC